MAVVVSHVRAYCGRTIPHHGKGRSRDGEGVWGGEEKERREIDY